MSAACKDYPKAVFFPESGHTMEQARLVAQAKEICASCPVIDRCRADHSREDYGIWFGTTPKERGRRGGGEFKPASPTARDAVAAVLSGSPGRRFTAVQMAEWLSGSYSKDAVQQALRRLSEAGKVQRIFQPGGRPHLYRWVS